VTVRPLRLLGDPVLRTPSDPVERFDRALAQLVTDLIDTVQVPGRAGLAANQIGSGLAVFAYNVDGRLGYVINPMLAETSGEQSGEEGCLSIPGVTASRVRAAHAVVTGVDLDQQLVTVAGDGALARALQHETDHLRGELYIDALSGPERRAVMRALREPLARLGSRAYSPDRTARIRAKHVSAKQFRTDSGLRWASRPSSAAARASPDQRAGPSPASRRRFR
jgi:peptide deformylase